ncbi:4-hydroxy-tetrahydrodipicolinate reductase [Macrococcus brunensis]|uniref:4-hydroxy-tetrahydrodipicolinate reductase n=1 Tax=Macrococcus brunensis TaxID=198483 RepID=UPI001EEFA195|nr:4-hydroxy-tetrahydrodipicolinate reductase [Macrococcus brunensis]ULG72269.1 4-hydroxy-tetrahydrodipicolinate reductase [Macrococcus brunensis]
MKILLVGYGAMNERVARLAEERGHSIAGIITKSDKSYPYPSFKIEDEWPAAEVIIDFSHPDLSLPVIRKKQPVPLVMATTGRKEEIIQALESAAAMKPVFFSANMSYGVHILTEIIKYSVPLLQSFDIELTEKHHRKKVDAPSGTLVKLYDAIKEKRQESYPVYDRTELESPRTDDEIGINVVRGGTIVGEHEVLFAGQDETIQIIHRAQSKDIFASGSLDVAEKLINKKPGFYTFDNL